jgi:large subunit ribosomal protein L6
MSRIGKQPVSIPASVKVKVAGGKVLVEGPKGKLELAPHRLVTVEAAKQIKVTRKTEERLSRALHGLTRTLVANMVKGVTEGYEKKLKIEGVGYGAKMEKTAVILTVGFANQIKLDPPPGVSAEVPDPSTIIVRGADKQRVGQFAAELRHARPPEPYQGKGVRYEKEVVRRKEGKSFTSGG